MEQVSSGCGFSSQMRLSQEIDTKGSLKTCIPVHDFRRKLDEIRPGRIPSADSARQAARTPRSAIADCGIRYVGRNDFEGPSRHATVAVTTANPGWPWVSARRPTFLRLVHARSGCRVALRRFGLDYDSAHFPVRHSAASGYPTDSIWL